MAKDLFDVVLSGTVKIEINQSYPLKDAAQAHRDLESRKTVGSTTLRLGIWHRTRSNSLVLEQPPMRLKFRLASDLFRPTVNKQLDAGNEAAVVRGEGKRRSRRFRLLHRPSHGDAAAPLFYFLVHKHIQPGRLNHARAHHINSDLPGFEIKDPVAGEGADGRLGRVVNGQRSEALRSPDRTAEDNGASIRD